MKQCRLNPALSRVNRSAFTLVELTIALLLSCMMIVSVMGLTSRLAKNNRLMHQKYPSLSWVNAFQQRLQVDYEGCRSLQVDSNRIKMRTFIIPQTARSSVTNTREMTHQPVEVTYSIQTTDQSSFVVRDERIQSSLIPESRTREVIAFGPATFVAVDRLDTDIAPPSIEIQILNDQDEAILNTVLLRFAGAGAR